MQISGNTFFEYVLSKPIFSSTSSGEYTKEIEDFILFIIYVK